MTFRRVVKYKNVYITVLNQLKTSSCHENKKLQSLLRTMEKVAPRHVKYRNQLGGKLPVPSKIDVHVIGSGGRGAPRSIMISTDHVRYLFNCGEGTQRIATEHNLKVSRLENIFITNRTWRNIGGLLGLALTLESTHISGFTVHGPPEVEKMILMVKGFAETSNFKVEKRELDSEFYEDSAFRIDYVPLYKNNRTSSTEVGDPRTIADDSNCNEAPNKKRRLSSSSKSEVVVAYICMPFPGIRKVILEKCVDLGVPRGPYIGKLTSGESITLEDGTVIEPDDILSPAECPRPIIVLECPNTEYLDAILSAEKFHKYQEKDGNTEYTAELVIHSTPESVMAEPRYQEFIARFGSNTKHLVLNETTSGLTHEGTYRVQAQLNLLSSRIFPLLPHQHLLKEDWKKPVDNPGKGGTMESEDKMTLGRPLLSYNYRPWKKFIWDQCLSLNNKDFIEEATQQEDFTEKLEQLKKKISSHPFQSDRPYPEVVFLGTGSSVPNKVRNVSSILLHTDPDTSILLDCGEGTAGQIYRHYGSQADDVFRKIQAVYVSHMHADHHLGLFGVLSERQQALLRSGQPLTPIFLLAPLQLNRWLQFYGNHIESVKEHIRLMPLQKLLPHLRGISSDIYQTLIERLHLQEFLLVEVDHVPNSFGVAVTHTDGWKVVYSGDTRPCQRLVQIGLNCDLLIHEATMEDDLIEEAKFKKHSTTSEAIDIGLKMGARFTLLNHFSQRYHRIPVFNENFSEKVGISYDNMRVGLDDLKILPYFIEPLKAMFSEEYSELADKAFKRTQKKQRQQKKMKERNSENKSSDIENASEMLDKSGAKSMSKDCENTTTQADNSKELAKTDNQLTENLNEVCAK